MDSLVGFVCDDHLLIRPLAALGWQVDVVSWRRTDVDWGQYEVVVIRSAWDYDQAPKLFLQQLQKIVGSGTRLENDLTLVHWNWQKTYLRDLDNWGIKIVPTLWLKSPEPKHFQNGFEAMQTEEIILKPVIGANANDTFRVDTHVSEQQIQDISAVLPAGKSCCNHSYTRSSGKESFLCFTLTALTVMPS